MNRKKPIVGSVTDEHQKSTKQKHQRNRNIQFDQIRAMNTHIIPHPTSTEKSNTQKHKADFTKISQGIPQVFQEYVKARQIHHHPERATQVILRLPKPSGMMSHFDLRDPGTLNLGQCRDESMQLAV